MHIVCTKCKACQFLKRNKKQYGKLHPKVSHTLCVRLIGTYQLTPNGGGKQSQMVEKGDTKKLKMTTKSGKSVYLQAVTMINPTTG